MGFFRSLLETWPGVEFLPREGLPDAAVRRAPVHERVHNSVGISEEVLHDEGADWNHAGERVHTTRPERTLVHGCT